MANQIKIFQELNLIAHKLNSFIRYNHPYAKVHLVSTFKKKKVISKWKILKIKWNNFNLVIKRNACNRIHLKNTKTSEYFKK